MRLHETGKILLPVLGFLFSLFWIYPLAMMIATTLADESAAVLTILVTLVLVWIFAYIRLLRWWSRRRRPITPQPDLALQRASVRRSDTARSVVMALLWPMAGITGVLLISILASVVLEWMPAAPGYSRELIMVVFAVLLLNAYVLFITRKLLYKPTGRFVLWLRRFHENGAFPFNTLLEDASRGIALPVTVQDTTVARSSTAASTRASQFASQALVGICLMSGFVLLVNGVQPGRLAAILGPLILLGYALVIWLQNSGGNSDLRTKRGQKRLRELLHLMDSNQKIPQALTIVRMSDENWKEWVEEFIRRADAIIVDVTHLTESLNWELQTCSRCLQPAQMILACGSDEDSEADPWPSIKTRLEEILGHKFVAACQRFNYLRPRKKPFWSIKFRGWEQREAKRLRKQYEQVFLDKLQVAFEHSPPREQAISTGPTNALSNSG